VTIEQGLEEAYASVDNSGVVMDTIQIDHIALDEPLYFLKGTPKAGEFEVVQLPVVNGGVASMANFVVIDFFMQRPGQDDSGITRAKIRIDNVSRILNQVMSEVIASDKPFDITYRAYWSEDVNNPEVFTGLHMNQVAINASSAEGEVFYDEVEMKAFPRETYDLARFPSLFR
jgi:hypothetical protein